MKTLAQLSDEWFEEERLWAAAHPVPLPDNPEMLQDLADIGVPGAAKKLDRRYKRLGRLVEK